MAKNFSDTFTGNGVSPGSAWTVENGSFLLVTDTLDVRSGGWVNNVLRHNTACDTINQYVKVSLPTLIANAYPGIFFRITDDESPMYAVFLWAQEGKITFERLASVNTDGLQEVQAINQTIEQGQTWGFTCVGEGNDVVVRGWLNPTANAPDVGGATWDEAAPTVTFTANPTEPVDSGYYIGLGGQLLSPTQIQFDNFFGGDVPMPSGGGGGGTTIIINLFGMN